MNIEFIEFAYNFVNDYKYMNIKTGGYNKFDFEYTTPSVKGISKYQQKKDLQSVKPFVLEYIIYYLQDAEQKMIIDAIIAYLYYWKIRKANTKQMRKEYKKILNHYRANNDTSIPLATITYTAMVYSISFYVGSIRINKFGLATDPNRYRKLISDVRSNYSFVSIGNFTINQEIQFNTLKQAEAFELEAITNLKLHNQYSKGKYYFNGYTESYLHCA